MKIIAVLGSPHKKGNTAVLLEHYLKGVSKSHKKVDLDMVFLNKLKIKTCQACNACKKGKNKKCKIKDDMTPLYNKIAVADVIILASPIYWWNISAQMKTFIDRLYAIDFSAGVLKGKKLVFLTTFGAKTYQESGAGFVENALKATADFTGMEFVHHWG